MQSPASKPPRVKSNVGAPHDRAMTGPARKAACGSRARVKTELRLQRSRPAQPAQSRALRSTKPPPVSSRRAIRSRRPRHQVRAATPSDPSRRSDAAVRSRATTRHAMQSTASKPPRVKSNVGAPHDRALTGPARKAACGSRARVKTELRLQRSRPAQPAQSRAHRSTKPPLSTPIRPIHHDRVLPQRRQSNRIPTAYD